jgi:predicted nucleic acid-binding protein
VKKLKIYLDTSTIGYLEEETSPKEMDDMQKLWELLKRNGYEVIISPVVVDELMSNSNITKRNILLNYLKQISYDIVDITNEVHTIARLVIQNGILTDKNYNDCLHIACAISNNCDCLVSYNFKHLVNIRTIKGVRAISNLTGYGNIDIVSAVALIQKGDEWV